jgi:hypothetical protein
VCVCVCVNVNVYIHTYIHAVVCMSDSRATSSMYVVVCMYVSVYAARGSYSGVQKDRTHYGKAWK